MGMTLREKQSLFSKNIALLILFVYRDLQATTTNRLELTMGEGYIGDSINKPTEDTPHKRTGAHFKRLGQDFNLFINGQWIEGDDDVWHVMGEYWLSLHPDNRWGGNFASGDFNHFSMIDAGIA